MRIAAQFIAMPSAFPVARLSPVLCQCRPRSSGPTTPSGVSRAARWNAIHRGPRCTAEAAVHHQGLPPLRYQPTIQAVYRRSRPRGRVRQRAASAWHPMLMPAIGLAWTARRAACLAGSRARSRPTSPSCVRIRCCWESPAHQPAR